MLLTTEADRICVRHRASDACSVSRVVSVACSLLLLLVEGLPKGRTHQQQISGNPHDDRLRRSQVGP